MRRGYGKDDRDQQDEADFEKRRQPHHQADNDHGPVDILFAEDADKGVGNLVCAARLRHHLAEHGPQCHNDRDVA